jgi:hypothetical protein
VITLTPSYRDAHALHLELLSFLFFFGPAQNVLPSTCARIAYACMKYISNSVDRGERQRIGAQDRQLEDLLMN